MPEAKLGGPPFEGTFDDVEVWPDAAGKVSWLGRFLDYLKAHGRMNDFTFFSFEHYPYQDKPTYSWADLYPEPDYVRHIVQVWKDDGLPPNIPFFMTEGNIGGGAGVSTVKGALWLADYVGSMMMAGAGATYYFHYMPSPGRWGAYPLLLIDEADVRARMRAMRAAFPWVAYAIKAFTSHLLIRITLEEGLDLLCASGGELEACLRAVSGGVCPRSIATMPNPPPCTSRSVTFKARSARPPQRTQSS